MNRGLIITALLLALAGCGKRGQLLPPEALVPAAVESFQVQQRGADIRITWQAPTHEQGGRPLRDLAGFRLLRRDLAGDAGDCAACPDAWQLLTFIDTDLPTENVRSGATYIYTDRQRPVGSVSQYRLLALGKSGGSSAPATSTVKRVLPPVAPPTFRGAVLPAAIALSFTAAAPVEGKLVGFNVYRRQDAQEPLLPLNPLPITAAAWEDRQLQFGTTYRYRATTLMEIAGETVESLATDEIELVFSLQELR
jgi:predicted small lipoprotein YifL